MAGKCDYQIKGITARKKDEHILSTCKTESEATLFFAGQCKKNGEEFTFIKYEKIVLEYKKDGFDVFNLTPRPGANPAMEEK